MVSVFSQDISHRVVLLLSVVGCRLSSAGYANLMERLADCRCWGEATGGPPARPNKQGSFQTQVSRLGD